MLSVCNRANLVSLDRVLRLVELRHEVLRERRADLGVALLGLGDELVESMVLVSGVELKVELAALHVPVVRVEQAPRIFVFGIGFDEGGHRGRWLLDLLRHAVGFEEHLGGAGDQRPACLHRWQDLSPKAG